MPQAMAAKTAKNVDPSKQRRMTITGTHGYRAPEVYERDYGKAADWWNVGILIIEMLTADIFRPHVDIALEPEVGAGGRCCYAMLTRAGFSDDAVLFHLLEGGQCSECAPCTCNLAQCGWGCWLGPQVWVTEEGEHRGSRGSGQGGWWWSQEQQ